VWDAMCVSVADDLEQVASAPPIGGAT